MKKLCWLLVLGMIVGGCGQNPAAPSVQQGTSAGKASTVESAALLSPEVIPGETLLASNGFRRIAVYKYHKLAYGACLSLRKYDGTLIKDIQLPYSSTVISAKFATYGSTVGVLVSNSGPGGPAHGLIIYDYHGVEKTTIHSLSTNYYNGQYIQISSYQLKDKLLFNQSTTVSAVCRPWVGVLTSGLNYYYWYLGSEGTITRIVR